MCILPWDGIRGERRAIDERFLSVVTVNAAQADGARSDLPTRLVSNCKHAQNLALNRVRTASYGGEERARYAETEALAGKYVSSQSRTTAITRVFSSLNMKWSVSANKCRSVGWPDRLNISMDCSVGVTESTLE